MNNINKATPQWYLALLLLLSQALFSAAALADDVEIYNTTDSETAGDANIVFLLDNSTSMEFCINTSSDCSVATNTRFFALRKAMATVLDPVTGLKDTTKVALFTYAPNTTSDGYSARLGATMLAPLRALGDRLPGGGLTQRQYLLNWFAASGQSGDDRYVIGNAPPNFDYNYNNSESTLALRSYTPLETAYAEIGKYLQGKRAFVSAITNLTTSGIIRNSTNTSSLDVSSTATPLDSSNNYVAPSYVDDGTTCAPPSWNVILVTDGEPTGEQQDNNNNDSTRRLPFFEVAIPDDQRTCDGTLFDCSKELAAFLASNTLTEQEKSWTCIGDCTYTDNNGNQQTASEPSLDQCTTDAATYPTTVRDYRTYNWECRANYGWSDWSAAICTTDSNLSLACNAGNNNATRRDFTGTTSTCVGTPNYTYNWVTGAANSCTSNFATTCNAANEGRCRQGRNNSRCTAALASTTYAWDASGSNGGSCTSAQNTSMTCNASNVNRTRCTGTCQGATCGVASVSWQCASSDGGSCSDTGIPTPRARNCDDIWELGATAATQSYIEKPLSWRCNIEDVQRSYNNQLGPNGANVEINTHAIFVGPDLQSEAAMRAIALNGGGEFYNPTSVSQLATDLVKVVSRAEKLPNTIAAPGVAVNQLSRFQHLDQLYYSVFKPEAKSIWEGNLKRYWLNEDSVKDALGIDAVDSSTRFFNRTARSCWGDSQSGQLQEASCYGFESDGSDATLGGARSKVDDNLNARNVLTTLDNSTVQSLSTALTATSATLADKAALMGYCATCTNTAIPYNNGTITALGADSTAQLTRLNALVAWASGQRTSATQRNTLLIGDPLHSQPVLVNYGFDGDTATGDTRDANRNAALEDGSKQENYVFFSTNAGVLHAIEANHGTEEFAFMPRELLPLIPKTETIPDWIDSNYSRLYGLDSTWVPWRRDANGDGDVKDSDDWVYLYGGMRMGGSNYYALDVTDVSSPDMLWTINGPLAGGFATARDGSNNIVQSAVTVATPPTSGPFQWMGQTWSKPVLARLGMRDSSGNETGRTVLVFGGGYDPANETLPPAASAFGTDAYGHQLYIVDAKTGAVLFWAAGGSGTYGSRATAITESPTLTVSNMRYSITGSPVPVDRDGDGFTDLIYFADLGGQVFRLDLKNTGTNGGAVNSCSATTTTACADLAFRVARIASLGEAASANSLENQRRFFESPGVAILQRPGETTQYMGVAIGSGNRSHPSFTGTRDRVFLLEDNTALLSTLNGITVPTLTASNLQDVTSYSYNATTINTFTGRSGYYFDVTAPTGTDADGEKVFSTPLIFQGEVYLTTYVPESSDNEDYDACSPGTGTSSLAIFNVFDGRAEAPTATSLLDRTVEGITSTITGDVQIVFNADGTSTILAGTYTEEADTSNKGLRRTRWYEKAQY